MNVIDVIDFFHFLGGGRFFKMQGGGGEGNARKTENRLHPVFWCGGGKNLRGNRPLV